MSLIFFAQTFCIVFTLNYVSHNLGAVHKQCGPKRGRGRQFFLLYGITWFIVHPTREPISGAQFEKKERIIPTF